MGVGLAYSTMLTNSSMLHIPHEILCSGDEYPAQPGPVKSMTMEGGCEPTIARQVPSGKNATFAGRKVLSSYQRVL